MSTFSPPSASLDPRSSFLPAKILVGIGIVLRGIQFFVNQGLREDEGNLVVSLIKRDLAGVLEPLDRGQIAPPLFLMIQKINLIIFGNHEFAIRGPAFVCSCLALILVYFFMKAHTNAITTTFTVAFMAINRWLIFSAVAAKQYSGDVLVTVLMFYLLFSSNEKIRNNRMLYLAITGAVAIWLSHVSVIILFSIGLYLMLQLKDVTSRERINIVACGAMWAVSFAMMYLVAVKSHPNQGIMLDYWRDHFMPLPPATLSDLKWYPDHFIGMISFALGYSAKHFILWLPHGVCFLAGIYFTWRNKNNRRLLWIVFPIIVHLVLSGFKLYPFNTRLTLYLTFPVCMMMGIGLTALIELTVERLARLRPFQLAAGVIIVTMLAITLVDFPYKTEDVKKSLSVMKVNFQPGDKIYAYYSSDGSLSFYKEKYVPKDTPITSGKESRKDFSNYITQTKDLHGRVWFIFSHIYTSPEGIAEDKYIIDAASKRGKVLIEDHTYQASVYLVELN